LPSRIEDVTKELCAAYGKAIPPPPIVVLAYARLNKWPPGEAAKFYFRQSETNWIPSGQRTQVSDWRLSMRTWRHKPYFGKYPGSDRDLIALISSGDDDYLPVVPSVNSASSVQPPPGLEFDIEATLQKASRPMSEHTSGEPPLKRLHEGVLPPAHLKRRSPDSTAVAPNPPQTNHAN
jgi:hypothetical protein